MGNLFFVGVIIVVEVCVVLFVISGVIEGDLICVEVIWSFDIEGEFFSEDEVIVKYFKLIKL